MQGILIPFHGCLGQKYPRSMSAIYVCSLRPLLGANADLVATEKTYTNASNCLVCAFQIYGLPILFLIFAGNPLKFYILYYKNSKNLLTVSDAVNVKRG